MAQRLCDLAGIILVLYFATCCDALRIAAVGNIQSIGVLAISQELLLRGHDVRVIVSESQWSACRAQVTARACLPLRRTHRRTDLPGGFADDIKANLKQALRSTGFQPDVFVTVSSLDVVADIAKALDTSTVLVVDDARDLADGKSQRRWTLRLLDYLTSSSQRAPLERNHLIVPFPFSLGVSDEQRYPNVHVLGFVRERLLSSSVGIKKHKWHTACRNAILYVHLSVEDLGQSVYDASAVALDELSRQYHLCVVWRFGGSDRLSGWRPKSALFHFSSNRHIDADVVQQSGARLFLTSSCELATAESAFYFESLLVVFRGTNATGVACPVLEHVPSDLVAGQLQPGESLYQYVERILADRDTQQNARFVSRFNHMLGGAPKAADAVEIVGTLGYNNTDYMRAADNFWRREDIDVSILGGLAVAIAIQVLLKIFRFIVY